MFKYLLGRLGTAVPTLLAVLLITFTLVYVSPFDPVKLLLLSNEVANLNTEQNVARIRAQYGLDQPYSVQFLSYLGKLAHGNWGISIVGQRDIRNMISQTLPISAQLGLAAAALTTLIGIPLGMLAALKHNRLLDNIIVSGTLVLYTVPVYVLGPLLLILFVLVLHVMKVPRGWHGLFSWQSIMPVLLLSFGPLAIVVRQTRQSVLEVLTQDYIRTARAKGLTTMAIASRHMMRNALIPVVTALGLVIEGLVTSTVFIDTIFAIPGFGSIAANALTQLDYPVILGVTLVSSILVIITNTLVDLVYPVLDPRVTLGK